MASKQKRTRKLIEPRLQMKIGYLFIWTAMMMVLVQTVAVGFSLNNLADQLPNDGDAVRMSLYPILLTSMVIAMGLLAPLTLAVGIHSTFKIVGPIYRFRVYLTELMAGENPQPCKIRKDDELQDFCELLNQATAPLRETRPEPVGEASAIAVEREEHVSVG